MILINERGVALVVAMIMTILVMIIGVTAIKMNEIGYLTYDSERRYMIARESAEYAVNAGIQYITLNSSCPTSTSCSSSIGVSGVGCTYFAISISGQCLVFGEGTYRDAKVVKTSIVPAAATATWGALVMDSGTLNLGGSGAVAFCDDSCPNGGPAVIHRNLTSWTGSTTTVTPTSCPNNPSGYVGSPPISQNTSIPDDMTNTYFTSSNWSSFVNDLKTQYGVTSSDISALSSSCKYTGTSSCSTTSTTNIKCGSGGSEVNISLSTCQKVYLQQATLTINHAVSNKTISSGSSVTITGNTTDVNVFANVVNFNLPSLGLAQGGVYYSDSTSSSATVYVKSNAQLGSTTKPIMYITNGPTTFDSNGGPDIYGLVYTKSTTINVNGNIKFNGSFIDDSTGAINFGGNAVMYFDSTVLNTLRTNVGSIMRQASCPAANRAGYITNSKITVY